MTRIIHLYPDEKSKVDIVGDKFGYLNRVIEVFGTRKLHGTALGWRRGDDMLECEQWLRWFLKIINPKVAVEIGTWRGVMTALLAHYVREKVYTLDIRDYPETNFIWSYFGVEDKIKYVLVPSEKRKKNFLASLDFDFAFIDGNHTYEGVSNDFVCVKKCGRVLFHDYFKEAKSIDSDPDNEEKVGTKKFVDTLPQDEVQVFEPFAYWEKK